MRNDRDGRQAAARGKMTLEEAKKVIEEIHERYGIQFSETQEKRENGRIKTIYVTLKFRIEEKGERLRSIALHGSAKNS
jgi:polyhydroxyalkanoate synthesis regulator phasin